MSNLWRVQREQDAVPAVPSREAHVAQYYIAKPK